MKLKYHLFICAVLIALWPTLPSNAHKVTIFAWVEGGLIHTQSKFSGGRPAKDALIMALDKQGNTLLEGKSDANGEFSFPAPAGIDLKIVLKASMGHVAEWEISAQEIAESASAATVDSPEFNPPSPEKTPPPAAIPTAALRITLTEAELQQLVEQALDKKLAPLYRMLVQLTEQRPGLTEILGGLGYIIGLVSLALYLTNRKKGS